MRDDHIIELIEERSLNNLNAIEIDRINGHTAQCDVCLRAFQAAMISSRLLSERDSVTVEPQPFFHTRTLAAIREKGLEKRPGTEQFSFWKMWQAARILIASMAAVVLTLTFLTFMTGRTQSPSGYLQRGAVSSVDTVFDDDSFNNDDLTDSQVFTNLYDQEAEGSDGNQQ